MHALAWREFVVLAFALYLLASARFADALRQTPLLKVASPLPASVPNVNRQSTGNSMFGRALVVANNTLVVGEAGLFGMGRAHVFVRSGTGNFSFLQTLSGTLVQVPLNVDRFGKAIAISATGSVLAVGAPQVGPGIGPFQANVGAVYIFQRSSPVSLYTLAQVVHQPLAFRNNSNFFGSILALSADGSRLFGYSHGVDCPIALWSPCPPNNQASRGVYVFVQNSTGQYVYENRIQTSDQLHYQQVGQPFGVNADGSMLYIMQYDYGYDVGNATRMLVRLFSRTGSTWADAGTIRAPSYQVASQLFGGRILVGTNELYIAAPRNDSSVHAYAGSDASASIFATFRFGNEALYAQQDASDCSRPAQNWRTDGNFLGQDMALSPDGRLLALGAPFGVDALLGRGAVYLFARFSSSEPWTRVETFRSTANFTFVRTANDRSIFAATIDEYGLNVALTNDFLIVGAKGERAVYVYDGMQGYIRPPPPPPPPAPNAPPPPPPELAPVVAAPRRKTNVGLALGLGIAAIVIALLLMFLLARWAIRRWIVRRLLRKRGKKPAQAPERNAIVLSDVTASEAAPVDDVVASGTPAVSRGADAVDPADAGASSPSGS